MATSNTSAKDAKAMAILWETMKEKALENAILFGMRVIMIFIVVFIAGRLLNMMMKHYRKAADRKKIDPLLDSFLNSLIRTVYFVGIIFIVISIAGIHATSLATILGTAGIAVGLALQGSLSNLAGGILILFFRPFNKGDYISNNAGIEGSVDHIRILYTDLITPDNKTIVVPNGQLANNPIINFSRNNERRLDLIFSVSYDTPLQKVLDILHSVEQEDERILKNMENRIGVLRHSASSIDFAFRVWVKKEEYWNVYFDTNKNVKEIFDANGIEIPYQKIDIYNKS